MLVIILANELISHLAQVGIDLASCKECRMDWRGSIPSHPSPLPQVLSITGCVLGSATTLARLQSLLICAVLAPRSQKLQDTLSLTFFELVECLLRSCTGSPRRSTSGVPTYNITSLRLSSLLTFASMLAAGESKAAAATGAIMANFLPRSATMLAADESKAAAATGAIMANFLPRSATAAMVAERAHHIRVDADFVTCTQ